MSERRRFKDWEKERAWEKADKIPNKNPDLYREDKVGNVIYKHSYGTTSKMGWEVDHSKPLAEGGTYHPNNLQALQALQNRSKGSEYMYDYDNANLKGVSVHDIADTEFDRRSSDVRQGKIFWNNNGTVDGRCTAVKNGDVTLNSDGSIRANCRAVNEGKLILKK